MAGVGTPRNFPAGKVRTAKPCVEVASVRLPLMAVVPMDCVGEGPVAVRWRSLGAADGRGRRAVYVDSRLPPMAAVRVDADPACVEVASVGCR